MDNHLQSPVCLVVLLSTKCLLKYLHLLFYYGQYGVMLYGYLHAKWKYKEIIISKQKFRSSVKFWKFRIPYIYSSGGFHLWVLIFEKKMSTKTPLCFNFFCLLLDDFSFKKMKRIISIWRVLNFILHIIINLIR